VWSVVECCVGEFKCALNQMVRHNTTVFFVTVEHFRFLKKMPKVILSGHCFEFREVGQVHGRLGRRTLNVSDSLYKVLCKEAIVEVVLIDKE
jgi:hypothetical protein